MHTNQPAMRASVNGYLQNGIAGRYGVSVFQFDGVLTGLEDGERGVADEQ